MYGLEPLATSRYEEIMANQSGMRLLITPPGFFGSEPPPLKTEPSKAEVASATVRPSLSTVVIWPKHWAGVSNSTSAAARSQQVCEGTHGPPSIAV